jgi:hypothetical protein
MFGSKKEAKQDLRSGMWERKPDRSKFGEDRPQRQNGPQIASPGLRPQAEGQTTHE